MKLTALIAQTKECRSGLGMTRLWCASVIFISLLTLNACGGNGKTGTGTDKPSASTGSTSSESGTAYTPEQSSAYARALAPYLRKNHPNIYFSKSGGSIAIREGTVLVILPFDGKDSALETCNAAAAFAASNEAPFAVPNVKVETGPEPNSGSIKPSVIARGAAGGTCTIQ